MSHYTISCFLGTLQIIKLCRPMPVSGPYPKPVILPRSGSNSIDEIHKTIYLKHNPLQLKTCAHNLFTSLLTELSQYVSSRSASLISIFYPQRRGPTPLQTGETNYFYLPPPPVLPNKMFNSEMIRPNTYFPYVPVS
jgi:hypothetical protein